LLDVLGEQTTGTFCKMRDRCLLQAHVTMSFYDVTLSMREKAALYIISNAKIQVDLLKQTPAILQQGWELIALTIAISALIF